MSRWFRWYRCSTENPKFVVVASKASKPGVGGSDDRVDGAVSLTDVIAVWAVALEDASNPEHWGYLKKDANFIAIVLRWHTEEVQNVLDAMIGEGLIEEGGHIAKWEQYQYASDSDPTNAERQRRFYNKHKHTITKTKRTPNALSKRPDTDTETDKNKIAQTAFASFWKLYPRKKKKKTAEKALAKALRETSMAVITAALQRQIPQWTDPKFIPYPASWLDAGSWADEDYHPNGREPPPPLSDEDKERLLERYRAKQAEAQ